MVALRIRGPGRAAAAGKGSSEAEGQAHHGACRSWLTASRSPFPALNEGTLDAAISMGSPVRGLRPCRAGRCLTVNVPKPAMLTDSPLASPSVMTPRKALTAASASHFETLVLSATWAAMSDFFVLRSPCACLARDGSQRTNRGLREASPGEYRTKPDLQPARSLCPVSRACSVARTPGRWPSATLRA